MHFEFLCVSACLLHNLTRNSSGREFAVSATLIKTPTLLRQCKPQITGVTLTDSPGILNGTTDSIAECLWAQDFETLANPSMIGMLYFVLFMILFLENGLLPAAFLPGDSLLILVGVLIAKGAMGFPQTILLLTVAASLGCWVSYIQGRWLGNTRTVQNWLSHLPAHYHQRAHHLFHKHGLSALLIGRFIAFVRTLLPTIAGISGLNNARFQFFNWMSGLLWVLILTSLGYLLGKTPVFMKYEDQLMSCLMLLPVVLLFFGLAGSLVMLWKKKYGSRG